LRRCRKFKIEPLAGFKCDFAALGVNGAFECLRLPILFPGSGFASSVFFSFVDFFFGFFLYYSFLFVSFFFLSGFETALGPLLCVRFISLLRSFDPFVAGTVFVKKKKPKKKRKKIYFKSILVLFFFLFFGATNYPSPFPSKKKKNPTQKKIQRKKKQIQPKIPNT